MKHIRFVTIMVLGLSILLTSVQALTIQSRDQLDLDDKLSSGEIDYASADSILLAPIFIPSGTKMNDLEWIRGLHYYSAVRLGYPDMPFHYVVTPSGAVYKTNQYGEEAKVNIENYTGTPIVVAYLANPSNVDFSEESKTTIQELLTKLCNQNSIKSENVKLATLRFKLNTQTKVSTLETREVVGGWVESWKSITKTVKTNYKPVPKTYKIQVVEVKQPTAGVKPGDVAIVEFKIKNVGENTIYADSESSLYATKKDGKLSKFFLNGVWASQSQVQIIPDGQLLKPQEEETFQVKYNVPLYFGSQSEVFVIKNLLGNTLESSEFTVTLDVSNIEAKVVEILETGTGYLNVRSADRGNASVVTKVSPGERYILKTRSDNGYVQIDLGEGKLGWVSQKYVKIVN